MNNYIPDTNPFNLAPPPQWWLRQLNEFDNSLVVVPSRQGFFYRLAQRRPLTLKENITNDALFKESDTKMLAAHSLIPVTTIVANPRWDNPLMWHELAQRAPWRQGGAEKFLETVEVMEAKKEIDKAQATSDHLDYLGKDGWKYYNKKLGLRSHLWSPKTQDRSRPKVQTPLIKIAKS